jgi:predicted metalloprotease
MRVRASQSRRTRLRRMAAAATAAAAATILLSGCVTVVNGRAASIFDDPFSVGGLPATDGPSGIRDNAAATTGTVRNTDNGPIDRLALLSINDITEFWQQSYTPSLPGTFTPVDKLLSYDSNDPSSPQACGQPTYQLVNAFFCFRTRQMAWDRGVLLPLAQKYFGDVSVSALLAHEYGHAVQEMANLVTEDDPTLVAEQQADCFSGVYTRWVAEGKSPRFTLSTGDGLNHVLAGLLVLRDPIITPDDTELIEQGHGTALDRISAFQMGFVTGSTACAGINMDEITKRRGDLPLALQGGDQSGAQSGEVAINQDTVATLMEILGQIFAPKSPPTLSFDPAQCTGTEGSKPVSYCPATNTLSVDLAGLQQMGAPASESDMVLVQGDNTALSAVVSRYVLALQHERGLPVDTAVTGLRTACLTGVAQAAMSKQIPVASGKDLVLTAGDLDEAVAGLLTNGLAAGDVNGATVPAGFTRILAFRAGLLSGTDQCFARFGETG